MNLQSKLYKNELNSDFKAEVNAANLIENGIPIDQIEIFPNGGQNRAFSKDLEHIHRYISEMTDQETYRFTTNREGLYDMLPEGLFHDLAVGREILDENMMIHDIREKRRQERDARQFFSPFEAELNQFRLRLAVLENHLDLSEYYNDKSQLFKESWPELNHLNHRQKVVWLNFLPEIQQHKNDLTFLQNFLHLLLELPVVVERKTHLHEVILPEHQQSIDFQLGKGNLGVHTMVKNALKMEQEIIQIKLGPASPEILSNFYPNRLGLDIIQSVFDYLLPVDCVTELIYEPLPESKHTLLQQEGDGFLLGHTSFL